MGIIDAPARGSFAGLNNQKSNEYTPWNKVLCSVDLGSYGYYNPLAADKSISVYRFFTVGGRYCQPSLPSLDIRVIEIIKNMTELERLLLITGDYSELIK